MSQDVLIRSEGDVFLVGDRQIPKNNYRQVILEKAEVAEDRKLELSVSSEQAYRRWWYYEKLEHTTSAIDLARFNDSANLLFNHNRDDYIGVIEKAWINNDEKKLINIVRFDTHDLAERIMQSVNSGIIRNVSIGYVIDELVLEKKSKDDLNTYRATKWTPLETSLVTVPADASVGVGRSFYDLKPQENETTQSNWEELNQKISSVADTVNNFISEVKDMGDENTTTLEVTREEDINKERERSEAIFAASHQYNCPELAQRAIKEGWSIDQLRSQILAEQSNQKPVARTTDPIGMSDKEQERFSFQKCIQVALSKNGFTENCIEKEAHDEMVKRAKKLNPDYTENENVLIPVFDLGVSRREVAQGWQELARSAQMRNYLNGLYQRDLQVGNPIFGGNLVETELLSERFVDILRNRSILRQMGMQSLTGMVGTFDIPKQTAGVTDGNSVYWVGEDQDVGQIDSEFGLIEFRPKNVGSFMYVTRSMLLHSSIGMDNFIRRELAIALALGMDRAGLVGTGTGNEPLGIFNVGGVNVIIFGPDGAPPNWQKLVKFETKIAVANADERTMGWVFNAKTRGELKSRPKFENTSNETLWQSANVMSNQGYVAGYRAGVSNQVPGNLTKGTGTGLSASALGDWSRLVCAEWGTYELAADPYHRFLSGGVRVRIIHTCDIQCLQEKAFSVATDMSTPYSDAA